MKIKITSKHNKNRIDENTTKRFKFTKQNSVKLYFIKFNKIQLNLKYVIEKIYVLGKYKNKNIKIKNKHTMKIIVETRHRKIFQL